MVTDAVDLAAAGPGDQIPATERAFYVEEFRGSSIAVSLAEPDDATRRAIAAVVTSLAGTGARLVLVIGTEAAAGARGLPGDPCVLGGPSESVDVEWLADLWLAITDHATVVVEVRAGTEATVAGDLAAAVRALKLVVTDPAGGWGDPPRSFADVEQPAQGFAQDLAHRQGGQALPAIEAALAGGVVSVNLYRAQDLEHELFTFDGTGTLFTSGGYVRLSPLRVDDLPAVESLVAQGVADGVLRPRSRHELARLAITGLGARILDSGHLAGIVSLETEPYRDEQVGEVACLYAVSRFSGAGAGGLLVDGLVERATASHLGAIFAVTVSDAAAAFFVRKGFVEVPHDAIPAAKWVGYDATRKASARAFLRNTTL